MNFRITRGTPREYADLDKGQSYYSVSQVLKALDPNAFEGIDPYVMAAAQQRGTDLHVLFALRVLAEVGACDKPARPSGVLGKFYDGIEKFVLERKPRPKRVESQGVNRKLGYAGTLDFDGWLDDEPKHEWIVDLKAGPARAVHASQLHGYWHLEGNEKVKRVGSLYITKKGDYDLVEHTHDFTAWGAFQLGISMLRWREMKGVR